MWDSCNILKLTIACKRINKNQTKSTENSKKQTSPSLTLETKTFEHLLSDTSTLPVNMSSSVTQSYKPLYPKSKQFNRNTIAVTKGTLVKALYTKSNWVFIEIIETGEQGFIPIYCLNLSQSKSIVNERKSETFTRKNSFKNHLSLNHNRIRVNEDYQRQFVGDISVIESEVVTLIDTDEINSDWRLVRRGDGKQGYIPRHILTNDETIFF